jgi:hypothetical protein
VSLWRKNRGQEGRSETYISFQVGKGAFLMEPMPNAISPPNAVPTPFIAYRHCRLSVTSLTASDHRGVSKKKPVANANSPTAWRHVKVVPSAYTKPK